jgi:hypothetical protein
MRTHLLRTFYPSPAIEFDAGSAANEDCFASDPDSLAAPARSNSDARYIEANCLHDEYVPGGYAGI